MRLNVLVIDRSPPASRLQGNALIGYEVMRRLVHHRRTLVAPVPVGSAEDDRRQLADLFDVVHLVPRARPVAALAGSVEAHLADRAPMLPFFDLSAAQAFARVLRDVILQERFDMVHVRQLPMAGFGKRLSGPRLLELIDSETLGAERSRPATVRTRVRASAAAVIERHAMRRYRVVTAVAEADADRLRQLDPRRRVEVIPNGVDADYFRPQPTVSADPNTLVFVGAMSFPPNVAAMRHFCREVLPLVRRERPSVRLTIVGRDPGPAVWQLAELDGVSVTGEVDDVRPHLVRAAAVVVPMVSGSGIKNKVLEAMAAGRPVVGTSMAVEGLPVVSGREAVVADGPERLAASITSLLASPAQQDAIGRAARAFVEERYTWDACAGAYDHLYRELAAARRRA